MPKAKEIIKKIKSKSCTKEDIKKLIDISDSFMVIFNEDGGNHVSSIRWKICPSEEIVALEYIKAKTLFDLMDK